MLNGASTSEQPEELPKVVGVLVFIVLGFSVCRACRLVRVLGFRVFGGVEFRVLGWSVCRV